ncbi:MAG: hypothetical protein GW949_06010 [Spirochaetales bacterium]|nr:hypothetical protein [Spirochaetales bacterium]
MLKFDSEEISRFRRAGVYVLTSTDPWENLALEHVLFESLEDKDTLLVFYVNRRSVVCGKHQNIWYEGNVPWLVENKVPILRRMSGGGTVFHDLGNLNYSFLGPRHPFDQMKNLEFFSEVLKGLDIPVEISARGDLLSQGRKFSGNALWYKKDRVMHHGTLLVDADRQGLGNSLKGLKGDKQYRLDGHWVDSHPHKVVNLVELDPKITLEAIVARAVEGLATFSPRKNVRDYGVEFADSGIEPLLSMYRSWSWTFGRTHEFFCAVERSEQRLVLKVVGGLGVQVTLSNSEVPTAIDFPKPIVFGGRVTLDYLYDRMPWKPEALKSTLEKLNDLGKKSYGEEILWISNSY